MCSTASRPIPSAPKCRGLLAARIRVSLARAKVAVAPGGAAPTQVGESHATPASATMGYYRTLLTGGALTGNRCYVGKAPFSENDVNLACAPRSHRPTRRNDVDRMGKPEKVRFTAAIYCFVGREGFC